MKLSLVRSLLFVAGFALALVAIMPVGIQQSYAAPLANLTDTAEPPTRTPVPPTNTPPPGATPTTPPAATPTLPPNATPPPPPPDTGGGRPDLVVVKTGFTKACVGDIVTFTITVTNQGNAPARDVVVVDDVPPPFEVVGFSTSRGGINAVGNRVQADLGTVNPGDVITIQIQVRATRVSNPAQVTNTATGTTSSNDRDQSNNTSTITVSMEECRAISQTTPSPVPPTTTAVPPATPTPVPPPRVLPPTGDGSGTNPLALLALGFVLMLASLLLRRRSS